MSDIEKIKRLLALCKPAEREQLFRHLRQEIAIHPLEEQLHAKAEIILEAIRRAGGLTLRMLRGVIAQAAFDVEVVERLNGWQNLPASGDLPYDFLLADEEGQVRVQVKLQRSKDGIPWLACQARKSFRDLPTTMYVVETQKTRGGKKKGADTRPYRFGEFDVLAVSLYPSTEKWDRFMYTVGNWLSPDPDNKKLVFKYQPVASAPDKDWTDSFENVIAWFRSGVKKTIRDK
jgi:hypothetical protein